MAVRTCARVTVRPGPAWRRRGRGVRATRLRDGPRQCGVRGTGPGPCDGTSTAGAVPLPPARAFRWSARAGRPSCPAPDRGPCPGRGTCAEVGRPGAVSRRGAVGPTTADHRSPRRPSLARRTAPHTCALQQAREAAGVLGNGEGKGRGCRGGAGEMRPEWPSLALRTAERRPEHRSVRSNARESARCPIRAGRRLPAAAPPLSAWAPVRPGDCDHLPVSLHRTRRQEPAPVRGNPGHTAQHRSMRQGRGAGAEMAGSSRGRAGAASRLPAVAGACCVA